jgi:hypothetical protein
MKTNRMTDRVTASRPGPIPVRIVADGFMVWIGLSNALQAHAMQKAAGIQEARKWFG